MSTCDRKKRLSGLAVLLVVALAPSPARATAPPAYPDHWIPSPDGKTYVRVPSGFEPPLVLPYHEGQPIPFGYRVVERSRRGLLVPGYVLSATGYGVGVFAAMASGFANESSWLVIPWVGPWLTLGFRDYEDCGDHASSEGAQSSSADDGDNYDYAACVADDLVMSGLIVDGIVQATGGLLLLLGATLTKKQLVRSDYAWQVVPLRVAGAYGLGLSGGF